MLQESFAHAADDMQARALAEAQVEADRIVAATRSGARRGRRPARRRRARARSTRALADVARAARRRAISAALRAAVEALNRATGEFAARRMDRGVARALTGKRVDALG